MPFFPENIPTSFLGKVHQKDNTNLANHSVENQKIVSLDKYFVKAI